MSKLNVVGDSNSNRLVVSYRHNGNGRSGHILKDLFTSVILARLLGGQAVFNRTWEHQLLLPIEQVKEVLGNEFTQSDKQIKFKAPQSEWFGISYLQLLEFTEMLKQQLKECSALRVTVLGVFRIHLFQVWNWEQAKRIPAGSFADLVDILRRMYAPNELELKPNWPPKKIAIHVRRGDVANPKHVEYRKMGPGGVWNARFYQRCIDQLHSEYANPDIELFSESYNSDDLRALTGCKLNLGGRSELQQHIRQMVRADLFIPASSSLSTWLCYLTRGHVRVYNRDHIKQFDHISYPANFEIATV